MTTACAPAKPSAVTDGATIHASIDLAASPERVFRAITTDEVEQWWGSPETYSITQWSADLSLGGRWSLVVLRPDGQTYPASGIFLKIAEPRKLIQTRKYEWNHPTLGWVDTIVTFTLDPSEGGTCLMIRHDGFAGRAEAAAEHLAGWERFLTWLAAYVHG